MHKQRRYSAFHDVPQAVGDFFDIAVRWELPRIDYAGRAIRGRYIAEMDWRCGKIWKTTKLVICPEMDNVWLLLYTAIKALREAVEEARAADNEQRD